MARLVVSQNERLMLHLLELDRYRDDAEVPIGVSQEGIAQNLQIQVHNASRALASLQVDGLVSDRLAHIRGAPKRRRAYFLTEKGRRAAQAVKSDLSRRMVVVELVGRTQELTLEEALRKIAGLTGTSPNFNEVLDIARASDAIRSEDLARAPPRRVVFPEFIERSHGRPKVGLFFGRENELKVIKEALSSPEVSAVLLLGMAGIGKSTLASKLFDELAGKRSMFWYSFREWDTEGSFLTALAEFLGACGRHDLSSAFKRGAGHPELFAKIVNDLQGLEALLFLDDVQKPARELAPLSMLTEASRPFRSAKVILISRSVPTFFSKTSPGNMALELQGLDRDSAWKMAQSLNATDTMRVVNESHGHPLLIYLMARSGVGSAKGDVISFIEREVYSSLSHEERGVLEMLSVFRHPVPANAVAGQGYDAVARLKQRALVDEQEDGVRTHDLVRSFFLDRMGSDHKSSLHIKAAAFCEANPGVEWRLETLYHHTEAGDWPKARSVALANAVELGKEFPEETLALIARIPTKDANPREQAELLFLRGQLRDSMGNQEDALADFEECLALLGSEDPDRRALVLESVAKLQSQIERLSESLLAHEKALRLYEKSGDREAQSREWMNVGGVYRKKGDFERARQAYSKALSLATMDENRPAQAACLNNLALLDWDEGKLRDAELRLKESVRLARAVKDHLGEARGLENLAELFRVQVKLSEMTNLLLESSEAFRRAGEPVEFKRLQASCAESLGEQGRYEEAIAMCQKALEKPELRRRSGLFQKSPRFDNGDLALSSTLADLFRESGDLKGAAKEIARYTEMACAVGDSSMIAKGSLLRSLVFEDSGDLESAAEALEKAEEVLRSAGNSEGLVAVHMRRGIVEEKRGNDAAAAKHYAEAARHAGLIGDSRAYSLATESLRMVKENLSYSSPPTRSTSS